MMGQGFAPQGQQQFRSQPRQFAGQGQGQGPGFRPQGYGPEFPGDDSCPTCQRPMGPQGNNFAFQGQRMAGRLGQPQLQMKGQQFGGNGQMQNFRPQQGRQLAGPQGQGQFGPPQQGFRPQGQGLPMGPQGQQFAPMGLQGGPQGPEGQSFDPRAVPNGSARKQFIGYAPQGPSADF